MSLFVSLIDDAATFPPGNAALADAIAAFEQRRSEPYADLVASFVVRDIDMGHLPPGIALSVVLTGGAGQVAGVGTKARKAGPSTRRPRDRPPRPRRPGRQRSPDRRRVGGTPRRRGAGVRRAARARRTAGWLAAADVVAAGHELRLKFRTGRPRSRRDPVGSHRGCMDRRRPRPRDAVQGTAGLHRAVRHTGATCEHHGFLNLLAATGKPSVGRFDRRGRREILDERDGSALAQHDLANVRRWFTSFGSCSITEPRDDLLALGLLEATS